MTINISLQDVEHNLHPKITVLGVGGSGGETGKEPDNGPYPGWPPGLPHELHGSDGGKYGGGGGSGTMVPSPMNLATAGGSGAVGAVRIIWGPGRAFPNYNAGDI